MTILADVEGFLVTKGILGGITVAHKESGTTRKALRGEIDHLNQTIYHMENILGHKLPESIRQSVLREWAEAILTGRQSNLWQGTFRRSPEDLATIYIKMYKLTYSGVPRVWWTPR